MPSTCSSSPLDPPLEPEWHHPSRVELPEIDRRALTARPDRPARRLAQLHHMLAEIMAARVRSQVLASPALAPVLTRLAAGDCDLAQAVRAAESEVALGSLGA
jgi:hypothetical protein